MKYIYNGKTYANEYVSCEVVWCSDKAMVVRATNEGKKTTDEVFVDYFMYRGEADLMNSLSVEPVELNGTKDIKGKALYLYNKARLFIEYNLIDISLYVVMFLFVLLALFNLTKIESLTYSMLAIVFCVIIYLNKKNK